MLSPDQVSAVIVTRGDVDLAPIRQSWFDAGITDHVYWDNSCREDLSVFGRYAAIDEAKHDVVFVQDDDCVLAPEAFETLLAEYLPGVVTANMPPEFRHDFYRDHCLVGFGAIFDRDLPGRAFGRFESFFPVMDFNPPITATSGDDFKRACDIVFTALTPRKLVDVPYRNLPHATGPDRMYRQPQHVGERQRMLELALRVRDA